MKVDRVVLLDQHLAALEGLLFSMPGAEGAAFILCGQSESEHGDKLVSHAVIQIAEEDLLRRDVDGLTINSRALMRISKLARHEQLSVIFAHSHPYGPADFSEQDDAEERRLIPFLQTRLPNRIHGTLVLAPNGICARQYKPSVAYSTPADRCSVGIVGARIRLYSQTGSSPIHRLYDRQVRAFGPVVQNLLSELHVGIVGLGGTGSPTAEQLYRLGVGKLSLFDGDDLSASNLTRVYGSKASDVGKNKALVIKNHLDDIRRSACTDLSSEPRIEVAAYPEHITLEHIARELRSCDVIFGCTDKEAPRSILCNVALRYHIPIFDMGVLIDSVGGQIRGVYSRVTTLLTGEACLFCRGRISPERIRIESLSPEDRANQMRDGYAPELGDPDPAVIAFTSAVASLAVAEFLHRLTGFKGAERRSSEILTSFDENRIRTNRVPPSESCFCSEESLWGRGDEDPFLGMTWPSRRN